MARQKGFQPLSFVNKVRKEKGLKKIDEKIIPKRLSKEEKEKIALDVLTELFPQALKEAVFVFTPEMQKNLAKAVEEKLRSALAEAQLK